MFETLEQKTRREIDADLTAGGRLAQDRDDLDLTAGRGIVAREFPMKSGFGNEDYLTTSTAGPAAWWRSRPKAR